MAPFVVPTLPDPTFSADISDIHQFDILGFIQDAKVDGSMCSGVKDAANYGGTIKVNGITIGIPCNTVVQMPANTLKWAAAVDLLNHPPLTLAGSAYPSFEGHIIGNTVGGRHIAGLVFLSQQAANSGTGFITKIDYADGSIYVGGGAGQADPARIVINDPNGRFGRFQTPDDRFSVDDQNPTIHSATGYPMCVPRTDPKSQDDPLCPQKNRPLVAKGCRNFSQAGVPLPVSGDIFPPVAGQTYCTAFVMKSVTDSTFTSADPDPMQQVPFEVGDFIVFSGTLMRDGSGGATYISAHTIEANVAVFTQPGTQPSYVAIGQFGVGTADPFLAVGNVFQEVKDRIFLEAETTDVKTPVDIFMMDVDPMTGAVSNRWVTPYEMTGECNPALGFLPSCMGYSGGITTQNTGAQAQRARIRATKAPFGLLSQPTRTIRVMVRSLCPLQSAPAGSARPYDQAALDACVKNAPQVANGLVAGQYFAPVFNFIFPEGTQKGAPVVPNDFWHLPFLTLGEGAAAGGVGPLTPPPW